MTSIELSFDGCVGTAIGFGAAFAVVLTIWIPVNSVATDLSAWAVLASGLARFAVLAGVAVAIVYFGATLAYRHQTSETNLSPAVSRLDAGSRG